VDDRPVKGYLKKLEPPDRNACPQQCPRCPQKGDGTRM